MMLLWAKVYRFIRRPTSKVDFGSKTLFFITLNCLSFVFPELVKIKSLTKEICVSEGT